MESSWKVGICATTPTQYIADTGLQTERRPLILPIDLPICLISVFRIVIGAAITAEIAKYYESDILQWGH